METAKVDLRKLQMLNDRINQTIDALSQLRMTVHGLQHSPVGPQFGYGAGLGFGQQGFGQQGPWTAYGQQTQSPWQGIGQQGLGQQISPFGQGMFGQHPYQQGIGIGGISHTGLEGLGTQVPGMQQSLTDQYTVLRYAQAFPYLFSPVPAVPF
jgi:hypothetical protein